MLDIEELDGVSVVRMCHGKVNAMDIEFCRTVIAKLTELGQARRAIVVTGSGPVFSAGVDLKRLVEESESYLDDFLKQLSAMFRAMFEYPAPSVAAINGAAIAGGCILASACDYRLISPRAKIGIPEMRIGVALPIVAVEIMRFVAAPQKFQQIVSIGATWTGDAAVEAGLADECSERSEQLDAGIKKARELATIPSDVYLVCKRQMRTPAIRNMEANIKDFGAENNRLWHDPEVRTAIETYVDERLRTRK